MASGAMEETGTSMAPTWPVVRSLVRSQGRVSCGGRSRAGLQVARQAGPRHRCVACGEGAHLLEWAELHHARGPAGHGADGLGDLRAVPEGAVSPGAVGRASCPVATGHLTACRGELPRGTYDACAQGNSVEDRSSGGACSRECGLCAERSTVAGEDCFGPGRTNARPAGTGLPGAVWLRQVAHVMESADVSDRR